MKKGITLFSVIITLLAISILTGFILQFVLDMSTVANRQLADSGLSYTTSVNNIESAAEYFKDRMKEDSSAAKVGKIETYDLSGDPDTGTGYFMSLWSFYKVSIERKPDAINPTFKLEKKLSATTVTKTITFISEGGGALSSALFAAGTKLSDLYSVDNLSRMYINELAAETFGSNSMVPLIPDFEFDVVEGVTVEDEDNIKGLQDAVSYILDEQTTLDGDPYTVMQGYNAAENVSIATEIARMKEDLDYQTAYFTHTTPSNLESYYNTVISQINGYSNTTTQKNNLLAAISNLRSSYSTVITSTSSSANIIIADYQNIIDTETLTTEEIEFIERQQEIIARRVYNIEKLIDDMLNMMTAVTLNYTDKNTDSKTIINDMLTIWRDKSVDANFSTTHMNAVMASMDALVSSAGSSGNFASGYTQNEFSVDFTVLYDIILGIMYEANDDLIASTYSGSVFTKVNSYLTEMPGLVAIATLSSESSFNTVIYGLKTLVVEMLFPEFAPYDLLSAEYLSDPLTTNLIINSTDLADGKPVNLNISDNATIVINNDFTLYEGSSIDMEDGTLLIVNGNLTVDYEVPSIDKNNYEDFEKVVYINAVGATIIVTGDVIYTGYRAGDDLSDLYNSLAGGWFFSRIIAAIIRAYFLSATGIDLATPDLDLRVPFEGNFMVLGDAVILKPSSSNASNPRIRTTWYVKGHFDGSYMDTDGFYNSPSRANFIFANAISLRELDWQLSERDGYAFFIAEEMWDGASVYNPLDGTSSNFYSTTDDGVEVIDDFKTDQGIVNDAIQAGLDCSGILTWGLPRLLREGNFQDYIMY